jgi:hypothetical protein
MTPSLPVGCYWSSSFWHFGGFEEGLVGENGSLLFEDKILKIRKVTIKCGTLR